MITLRWYKFNGKYQTIYKGFIIRISQSSIKKYRKGRPLFTLINPNVKQAIDYSHDLRDTLYKADTYKGKRPDDKTWK